MMKNREGVGKPKLSLVVPPFVSRGSMYRIRAQSYWTKDWAFGLVGMAVNNNNMGRDS